MQKGRPKLRPQRERRYDAGRLLLPLPDDTQLVDYIQREANVNARNIRGQIRFMLRQAMLQALRDRGATNGK